MDGIQGVGEPRDYQNDIINLSKDIALKSFLGWDDKVPAEKWAAIREDADYCSHVIDRRLRRTALEHLLF